MPNDRVAEMTLDEWVTFGIENGYALLSGHRAYDGTTWVPTLVIQDDSVRALPGWHPPLGDGALRPE